MIVPVENRIYPPDFKEMEVDSFRNLNLCIPYSLAGEATLSGVRRWIWVKICYIRAPKFAPFNGMCFIPSIACFNRSGLQHDSGVPVEIEWFPYPPRDVK